MTQTIDYFPLVLGNMSQGLIFINTEGLVHTYNPAAEILLGPESDKILNTPVWDHFADDFFGFSLKEGLATGDVPGEIFITFDSLYGLHRTMEVIPTIIKDEGLILLLRDVTELKRLQAEEKRSDRLKALGELASYVAHEIRNPLGGIKGLCSLLEEDFKDNPLLQKIGQGIDNLNHLVNQILSFSRPLELKQEPLDLVPFLQEFVTTLKSDERVTNKIYITLISPVKSCPIKADPRRFLQVLWNLAINSLDALGTEGGKLTFELTKIDQLVSLSVTDTGCGMSKKGLEKIFEPFYTTKQNGHGFGLAAVHKIIEAHKWSIEAASEEGVGTSFHIALYHD